MGKKIRTETGPEGQAQEASTPSVVSEAADLVMVRQHVPSGIDQALTLDAPASLVPVPFEEDSSSLFEAMYHASRQPVGISLLLPPESKGDAGSVPSFTAVGDELFLGEEAELEEMGSTGILDCVEYDFSSMATAHIAFDEEAEAFVLVQEEYSSQQLLASSMQLPMEEVLFGAVHEVKDDLEGLLGSFGNEEKVVVLPVVAGEDDPLELLDDVAAGQDILIIDMTNDFDLQTMITTLLTS